MIKRIIRIVVVLAVISVAVLAGLFYLPKRCDDVTKYLPPCSLRTNLTFFADNFGLTADAVVFYTGNFDSSLAEVEGVDFCFSKEMLHSLKEASLFDLSAAEEFLTEGDGSLSFFSLSAPIGKRAYPVIEDITSRLDDDEYLYGYTAAVYKGISTDNSRFRSLLFDGELRYRIVALPFDSKTKDGFADELRVQGMKILSPLALGMPAESLDVLLGLMYDDGFSDPLLNSCVRRIEGKWYALALIRGGDPDETLKKYFDDFYSLP